MDIVFCFSSWLITWEVCEVAVIGRAAAEKMTSYKARKALGTWPEKFECQEHGSVGIPCTSRLPAAHGLLSAMEFISWGLFPQSDPNEVHVLSGYSQRPLDYCGERENPFRAHVTCFPNPPNVSVCWRQLQCIAQAVLKLCSPASTLWKLGL